MMSIFVMCRFSDFKLEVCGMYCFFHCMGEHNTKDAKIRPDSRFILLTGSPSEDAMLSSTVRNKQKMARLRS